MAVAILLGRRVEGKREQENYYYTARLRLPGLGYGFTLSAELLGAGRSAFDSSESIASAGIDSFFARDVPNAFSIEANPFSKSCRFAILLERFPIIR